MVVTCHIGDWPIGSKATADTVGYLSANYSIGLREQRSWHSGAPPPNRPASKPVAPCSRARKRQRLFPSAGITAQTLRDKKAQGTARSGFPSGHCFCHPFSASCYAPAGLGGFLCTLSSRHCRGQSFALADPADPALTRQQRRAYEHEARCEAACCHAPRFQSLFPIALAMVHTNVLGAAVASSSARQPRPRLPSSGSFHAGNIIPTLSPYDMGDVSGRRKSAASTRRQSTHKYHTFPTPPPKTPSDTRDPRFDRAVDSPFDDASDVSPTGSPRHGINTQERTPLPIKQLGLLALLSLCEQTALNSISPYLPEMVASFEEIPTGQEGLYVGLLASVFALAQLATNFLWGYLSDSIGRKPVMLLGTSMLMVCFAFFGFCVSYWQVVVVHAAMGLLNGNAAVVPTCVGEVTDRTNQSRAFTWLPVMYSIGGITGPALGGLLVSSGDVMYPFLAPNIGSAALLFAAVVVLAIWFDETLDDAEKKAAGLGLGWVDRLCGCGRRRSKGRTGSWSSRWPTRQSDRQQHRDDSSSSASEEDEMPDQRSALLGHVSPAAQDGSNDDGGGEQASKSVLRQLLNRSTVLVLLTYLVFQLTNISFNSLYPIFAASPPPTGRKLSPGTIGVLLSFAGLATIVFQILIFEFLKKRMGNLGTYRGALLGLAVSAALMPWVGYKDDPPVLGIANGAWWLYFEIATVLVIKNTCAVGGLSSVLLLVRVQLPRQTRDAMLHLPAYLTLPACLPNLPTYLPTYLPNLSFAPANVAKDYQFSTIP